MASALVPRTFSAIVCVAFLLAGCASVNTIDSTVQSYSALTAPAAKTTYRFERLPLEQIDSAAQASLEAMAARALAKVGLEQVASGARLGVQVSARVTPLDVGPWPGWPGWQVGVGFGGYYARRGAWATWPGFGFGYYDYFPPPPRYQREVSIVMRDEASGKVVYQSRAQNESSWVSSQTILPLMFEAALEGFPTPPQGVRIVRTSMAPAAN